MGTPFNEAVKLAYDYAHERKELQAFHLKNRERPKQNERVQIAKGLGIGGALGAGAGFLAAHGRVPLDPIMTMLGGTMIGSIAGGAIGGLSAVSRNDSIDESARISEMPNRERSALLASMARQREIEERERREWDRAHYQTTRADLRRIYL